MPDSNATESIKTYNISKNDTVGVFGLALVRAPSMGHAGEEIDRKFSLHIFFLSPLFLSLFLYLTLSLFISHSLYLFISLSPSISPLFSPSGDFFISLSPSLTLSLPVSLVVLLGGPLYT